MDNVLLSTEIDFYVETMKPSEMMEIGNNQWLDWHQRLQKLNQQALIEASSMREEYVKECLIINNKISVLVHEIILINIWKNKILLLMLEMESNPENTFIAYTVLYHEAVSIALLELVLFHSGATETLGESAGDLTEYSYDAVCQLLVTTITEPNQKESASEELMRQKSGLIFDIGMRCLTIIRYLAENLNNLPLNVSEKIYNAFDVPALLIEVLLKKPWLKNNKQYAGGRWLPWDGVTLIKQEAQIWLTLRQLLLDLSCASKYGITSTRQNQLMRLFPLITPILLDQLSPLIELQQWLYQATMAGKPLAMNQPVLLETILEIKQGILNKCMKKFKKIARHQLPIIFNKDKNHLREIAQSLTEAYNIDLIEKMEIKEKNVCAGCGKQAIQRCSQCKNEWYCSRSCQVAHWSQHKETCLVKDSKC